MNTLDDFAKEFVPSDAQMTVLSNELFVTKWNWDYLECLSFQKKAQEFIQKFRKNKIYIFTNHPHVFTLGKGNERGIDGLVDFDDEMASRLSFPLFKIHRGGGVTFHFPGQWIFYPIVSINQNYTLDAHTHWLLKSVRDVLDKDLDIDKVITANRLMGVWKERAKLASIGVGLSKFVTVHGLALNIYYDEYMFKEVNKINPCGISPTTYTTVDSFVSSDKDLIKTFHQFYLKRIFNL